MKMVGFLGPTYPSRSKNFQSDRTVNWYPELNPESGEKSPISLIGRPGLTTFKGSIGLGGGIRGMHVVNGVMYLVAYNQLFSLTTGATLSSSLGTLSTTTGMVQMADNGLSALGIGGNQLAICDGANLYIYNMVSGTFTTTYVGYNIKLVIKGDDQVDGSTVITDSSPFTRALTSGGLAQVDTAIKKYGAGSIKFIRTSSSGVTVDTAANSDFYFGSEAFSIDGYWYFDSVPTTSGDKYGLFSYYNDLTHGVWGYLYHDGTAVYIYLMVYGVDGVTQHVMRCAWTPSVSTWYHIAFIRGWGGNTTTADGWAICIDGVKLTTQYIFSNPQVPVPYSANAFLIGRVPNGVSYGSHDGYMDDFVVSKGSARWVSNFTPPTTPPSTYTPGSLAYLDGYFIVTAANSQAYFVSDLYNGLNWNGLATASVIATPDPLVACASPHQELWFIKEYSTEVWYNTGTPTSQGSPFSRATGAVIDYGTSAKNSVIVGAGSLFMLGNVRVGDGGHFVGVVMFNGYTPVVISPPAINYAISSMSLISDAYAYMYSSEGHTFYVITFPTGNATFAYDLTTNMWHERSTYNGSDPLVVGKQLISCCVSIGGTLYVGDASAGTVHKMSSSYLTDNGVMIPCMRIAPHIFEPANLGNVFIHRLQVDIEPSAGLGGTNIATLYLSDDGGNTFGTGFTIAMGASEGLKKELTWRRLGYTRNGVCRLIMVGAMKKVVLGGYVEASV